MNPGLAMLVTAAVVHTGFAAYLLSRREIDASRKALGLGLAATIPAAGIVLAVLALRVRGGGGSPALTEPEEVTVADRREYQRLLEDRAPVIERLAGERSERLTALSELARDQGREDIAALRWIIEHGERDAVIDAALTLEKMSEARMSEASAARRMSADASADELERAADRIADMIDTGLADSAVARRLASLARDLYSEAERRRGGGLQGRVAMRWARLELAALEPARALEIVGRAGRDDASIDAELARIRTDALFASRGACDPAMA